MQNGCQVRLVLNTCLISVSRGVLARFVLKVVWVGGTDRSASADASGDCEELRLSEQSKRDAWEQHSRHQHPTSRSDIPEQSEAAWCPSEPHIWTADVSTAYPVA
eukprot:3935396-Rhodomonas_salina.1